MSNELIAIGMLWLFVFVYSVAASIDFGTGFWSMVYRNQERSRATNIANRYLSPSWEVTNVFVVLIVIGLVSFFPGATFTLGTVLLVPGSLILLLLSIRSAFLVYSHSVEKYEKQLVIISGISGLFIPALLILVLPVTHGGFIDMSRGYEELMLGKLLTSPSGLSFAAFAISSTFFLSSLLLADYSRVSNELEAYRLYRRDAILNGPLTFFIALLLVASIRSEAPWLYDNLLSEIPLLIASAAAFFIGYTALWWPTGKGDSIPGRPRIAMIGIVIQYLIASYAYGKAHLPYIVYPHVTIESSFTHPNMFRALFVSYIVGFAILTPGFIYFWRMFMKDKRYLRQP
ncbi:cytochrome d ubiquinol oxidase subunit II [Aneurinibacillus sp. REN35]|uniref:cytochrome d ubiquinol oxidase subunit II n=1 Tax=Aneurinibacillus sp. REN35 TaxID=3237286 RepID=UPI003528A2B8